MFCPYCKREVDDDSVFCSYCGERTVTETIYRSSRNESPQIEDHNDLIEEQAGDSRKEGNIISEDFKAVVKTSNKGFKSPLDTLKRKWLYIIAGIVIVSTGLAVAMNLLSYSKYKMAVSEVEEGRYQHILADLSALKAYKNSPDWLRYAIYRSSIEVFNSGNIAKAETVFSHILGYRNSNEWYSMILANRIDQYCETDQWALAFSTLEKMPKGEHKDMLLQHICKACYLAAQKLSYSDNVVKALVLYEILDAQTESPIQPEKFHQELFYRALDAERIGRLDEATKIYSYLGDYGDAADRLEAMSIELKKEQYKTGITYNDLARFPDQYVGSKVCFYGRVFQVMEQEKDQHKLRLGVGEENVLYCYYDPDITKSRILKNDKLTVYGTAEGLYSYESTGSGTITLPVISIDIIEQMDY